MNTVKAAVAADLAQDLHLDGDITASLIREDRYVTAQLITREAAVVCGVDWFNEVYAQVDPEVQLDWQVQDGDAVAPNQILVKLTGLAKSIVTGERAAMNWLQTLSGTATVVSTYVACLAGTPTRLLDTRKTLPGLREAQKYAVICGGGLNHRMGLYDAFLIKENHILSCGSIAEAIATARRLHPEKKLEVEVESLAELAQAFEADVVMLDNFALAQMREAVQLAAGRVKLEVSGNIERTQLRAIAETGVDYVSVGALTKHVRAVDLSMRVMLS